MVGGVLGLWVTHLLRLVATSWCGCPALGGTARGPKAAPREHVFSQFPYLEAHIAPHLPFISLRRQNGGWALAMGGGMPRAGVSSPDPDRMTIVIL